MTSQKNCVICLTEIPLEIMKNVFYFILNGLFVLKIFKFLSRPFGQIGKTASLERFKNHDVTNWLTNIAIHTLPNIPQSKRNQTMKLVS